MKNSRALIIKRRNFILQQLHAEHAVAVEELAEALHVSPLTVRRDLDDLAARGLIERFYGGAKSIDGGRSESDAPLLAVDDPEKIKHAIAKKAASFIKEGDTVLINSSTTAFHMFNVLTNMNITIITNNANALYTVDDAKFELIFMGGSINSFKHSMVGALAIGALKEIRANKCFVGVSGISEDGILSTALFQEMAVNSSIIKRSNEAVIILADSAKIGVRHNFDIGSLADVSHVITDSHITKAQLEILKKYNAEIIIADADPA